MDSVPDGRAFHAKQEEEEVKEQKDSAVRREQHPDGKICLIEILTAPAPPSAFGATEISIAAEAMWDPSPSPHHQAKLLARISNRSHDIELEHAEVYLELARKAFVRARELRKILEDEYLSKMLKV